MKVPKPSLKLIAVLMFLAAVGLWTLPDPTKIYSTVEMGITGEMITKKYVPALEQISEADARLFFRAIDIERKRLVDSGQMDVWKNYELAGRIQYVMDRVMTKYDMPDREYECDYECMPEILYEGQALAVKLDGDLHGYCGTAEGQSICLELSRRVYEQGRRVKYVPMVRAEALAIKRYKLIRSLPFVLAALIIFLIDRGGRKGWSFERMVGRKVLQFAAHSVAIAFSFCGQFAIAQQIAKKSEEKQRQNIEKVKKESKNPYDTLTLWVFGSPRRDDQFIVQYDFPKGFVLLEQFRQTTDGFSASNLAAAGWKWRLGKIGSLGLVAGPSFDLRKGGYSGMTQVLPFANLKMPIGSFILFNKLFLNTDSGELTGSRHIVVYRGPPQLTPKALRGIQWRSEIWVSKGVWVEQLHGVEFNPAQMAGKPKSFWASFAIWPYWDFTPQPGHPHHFDVRITFMRAFTFAH